MLKLLLKPYFPLVILIYEIVRHYNGVASIYTIFYNLKLHPHSPSLLSVADTLRKYKVENSTLRLPKNELNNIPCPFIAHITKNNYDNFILCEEMNGAGIKYFDPNGRKHLLINYPEFNIQWTGVATVLSSPEPYREPNLFINKVSNLLRLYANLILLFAISSIIILLSLNNPFKFTESNGQIYVLSILGFMVSIAIAIKAIIPNNKYINAICSLTPKSNCNLSQEGTFSFFNLITWHDLGVAYFFTYIASYLIIKDFSYTIHIFLNQLCIIFSIYSLVYQFFILKRFCLLCTTTVAIFIFEFIALIPAYSSFNLFDIFTTYTFQYIILFLSILIIWVFIYFIWSDHIKTKIIAKRLLSFTTDFKLFNTLHKNESEIPNTDQLETMIFGNNDSENTLCIISNPLCSPCRNLHKEINMLTSLSNIKVELILLVNKNHGSLEYTIAKHIISAYKNSKLKTIKALDEYYKINSNSKLDSFQNVNDIYNSEEVCETLDSNIDWCLNNNINATPIIYYNGRLLPSKYKISDIPYLI